MALKNIGIRELEQITNIINGVHTIHTEVEDIYYTVDIMYTAYYSTVE